MFSFETRSCKWLESPQKAIARRKNIMATHEDFATQMLDLHFFVQAGSAMNYSPHSSALEQTCLQPFRRQPALCRDLSTNLSWRGWVYFLKVLHRFNFAKKCFRWRRRGVHFRLWHVGLSGAYCHFLHTITALPCVASLICLFPPWPALWPLNLCHSWSNADHLQRVLTGVLL